MQNTGRLAIYYKRNPDGTLREAPGTASSFRLDGRVRIETAIEQAERYANTIAHLQRYAAFQVVHQAPRHSIGWPEPKILTPIIPLEGE